MADMSIFDLIPWPTHTHLQRPGRPVAGSDSESEGSQRRACQGHLPGRWGGVPLKCPLRPAGFSALATTEHCYGPGGRAISPVPQLPLAGGF